MSDANKHAAPAISSADGRDSAPLLVYATAPDGATAERIARVLVEARLAACVNVLPGMVAIYAWEGRIERAEEVAIVMKSTTDRLPALQAAFAAHHPYQVPALAAVPITGGIPAFLDWIASETA